MSIIQKYGGGMCKFVFRCMVFHYKDIIGLFEVPNLRPMSANPVVIVSR